MNHFQLQAGRCFCSRISPGTEPCACQRMSYDQYLPEDDISRIGPLIPNGASTGLHFICLAAHQAFAAELFSVAYPKIYNYELVLNRWIAAE